MSLPCQPVVRLRLGPGASFGDVLILGDQFDGILGKNVLGTATVQIVDITDEVDQISIRRGRDRVFEQYTPGSATISFWDPTGVWNPDYAAGPYYGQIKPMRQVMVQTTFLGTEYHLFSGYIQSWDWEWPKGTQYAKVTIQAVDGFRLLALSNVDSVTGAATNDQPGTRINQILDMVSWPATMRNIDTGNRELQNDPGGVRAVLTAIQTVEETELGAFYMDTNGDARFKSRGAIAQQASGTAVTFADNGTGIEYQEIDVAFDDQELSNVVSVANHGGTAEIATNSASVTEYFARTYTLSELLGKTNAVALSIANSILNYRKDPRIRIESIGLELYAGNTTATSTCLNLDFGDPIYVIRTQTPTSTLDLRVTVQGIEHTITPDRWFIKFITREPLSTSFILGSSQFGILGTNTL
jgi:hypothetical protein